MSYKLISSLIRAFLVLSSFVVLSCGYDGRSPRVGSDGLDSMRTVWKELNLAAEYDSLIQVTRPFIVNSSIKGDSLSLMYSYAYMAQSYMYNENLDSLKYYLDKIMESEIEVPDYRLWAMVDNLRGIYSLKSGQDFSSALVHFKQMYEAAKSGGDVAAQLVALTNIVNIFYIKSDGYGLEYAETANELARTSSVENEPSLNYYRAFAELSMSQMLYLNGDIPGALQYLKSVDSLSENGGSSSLSAIYNLIYADILCEVNDFEKASVHYRKVFSDSRAEPGILSMAYLNFGRYCEAAGDTAEAIALYGKGIEVSYSHKNMIFISELLRRLSDLYYSQGDSSKAFTYLHQYSHYLDSLSIDDVAKEFNALLLSYQDMEHQNELQAKELDLLKARRKIMTVTFFCVVIVILAVSLSVIIKRQKKMYSLLVNRHQAYIQRFNSEAASAAVAAEPDRDSMLFKKVESLMRDEQIFRMKDLTLDRLAERLQTNRTYLSKAINRFSGMSFSNYVNMYRVNEATKIISDPSQDVLMKQLADDIGFNSVSVFSSVFQKETGLLPSVYRKEVVSERKKV